MTSSNNNPVNQYSSIYVMVGSKGSELGTIRYSTQGIQYNTLPHLNKWQRHLKVEKAIIGGRRRAFLLFFRGRCWPRWRNGCIFDMWRREGFNGCRGGMPRLGLNGGP